jgi:hypothetical protein
MNAILCPSHFYGKICFSHTFSVSFDIVVFENVNWRMKSLIHCFKEEKRKGYKYMKMIKEEQG